MIDEELYKRATAELDSDARNPKVWARACALASDDHDEARFLYTNLRVEEMLNTDGKQRTFSTTRHRREPALADADDLDLPELSNTKPKHSRVAASSKVAPPNLEIETTVAEQEALAGEVISADSTARDHIEPPTLWNEETEVATSGITSTKMRSTKQLERPVNQDVVSEVKKAPETKILTPEQQRTQELTQNLERQAQSMSSEQQPTVQNKQPIDQPPTLTKAVDEPLFSPDLEPPKSSIKGDYANQNTATSSKDKRRQQQDLSESMSGSYMMFKRGGTVKAIKNGSSWPALLFTFPWLLSKTMFGTAIVYGILWIVALAGLYTTGTSWLDAGAQAPLSTKLWTLAFAVVGLIGLFYIPFRYGNRWAAEKLLKRGYDFKTSVSASNKRDAVKRLMEAKF